MSVLYRRVCRLTCACVSVDVCEWVLLKWAYFGNMLSRILANKQTTTESTTKKTLSVSHSYVMFAVGCLLRDE